MCGRSSERTNNDHYPTIAQYRRVLRRWAVEGGSSTSLQTDKDERRVLRTLQRVLPGRSVYTLQDNSIAVGPSDCKSGDPIYVILGCEVPIVVRRVDNVGHRVIGPIYIPGCADGQDVLGELPAGWETKFKTGTTVRIFQSENGTMQLDDLRLLGIDLPGGWGQDEDRDGQPI